MKKITKTVLFSALLLPFFGLAQNQIPYANTEALAKIQAEMEEETNPNYLLAVKTANELGVPLISVLEDGTIIRVSGISENGLLLFDQTDNANAAKTTQADELRVGGSSGLNLSGKGITLGEWDGGAVRGTHQELTGRVTQKDGATGLSSHSTHVAGTMIATGIDANARGMCDSASLDAYTFNNDDAEMAGAASGLILSNHSYGTVAGWGFDGTDWYFYGDTSLSATEDYKFGYYDGAARSWDNIAYNAPYYLIVKSAGNDRGDGIAFGGHYVRDGGQWVWSTTPRGTVGPYDCVSTYGTSKNILTVGAVLDMPNPYVSPSSVSMSSFSGWGPTDDGRIKPDLVANGVSLYSTSATGNTNYYNSSGTSMSSPNATGSLGLVQEHYFNLKGVFMKAATLKALAIHTTYEAGSNPGPDYSFGWGLLNVRKAADVITNTNNDNHIIEATLTASDTFSFDVSVDGTQPLRATIAWTDIPAIVRPAANDDTTRRIVHDLDLRLIHDSTGTVYMPYILDPANPSAAATTGDNNRDNVEQVYFATPLAGDYTVQVTHKGTLLNPTQDFGLIISGTLGSAPIAGLSTLDTAICAGDAINFFDNSVNNPNGWTWIFEGATPDTSYASSPTNILYPTAGVYDVTLISSNALGADTIYLPDYINVGTPVATAFPTTYSDICVLSGQTITLSGGTPAGGYYSGPGITDSIFDPLAAGIGTHTISYNIENGGCLSTSTNTIRVVAPPVSIISMPVICESDSPFVMTAFPSGGTFIGAGFTDSVFDPGALGAGVFPFQYVVSANGCTDTSYWNVQVRATPQTPTITFLNPDLQSDATIGVNQWYYNGSPISGARSQTYTPTQNGVYTCVVTQLNCPSDTSNQISINNISIDENKLLSDLTIYPNPNKGQFVIELPGKPQNDLDIKIVNQLGVVVAEKVVTNQGKKVEFNLSTLSKGVYYVNISTGASQTIKKLVIVE